MASAGRPGLRWRARAPLPAHHSARSRHRRTRPDGRGPPVEPGAPRGLVPPCRSRQLDQLGDRRADVGRAAARRLGASSPASTSSARTSSSVNAALMSVGRAADQLGERRADVGRAAAGARAAAAPGSTPARPSSPRSVCSSHECRRLPPSAAGCRYFATFRVFRQRNGRGRARCSRWRACRRRRLVGGARPHRRGGDQIGLRGVAGWRQTVASTIIGSCALITARSWPLRSSDFSRTSDGSVGPCSTASAIASWRRSRRSVRGWPREPTRGRHPRGL